MQRAKINSLPLLIILVTILGEIFFTYYLSYSLRFVSLSKESFFLPDLIGKPINPIDWSFPFFLIASTILIWQIAKNFFTRYWAVIPAVIFGLCPWSIYTTVAQSHMIIMLCFFLALVLTFIHWINNKAPTWLLIIILLLNYATTLLIAPIIWLSLAIIYSSSFPIKKMKQSILIVIICYLPIIIFSIIFPDSIVNIIKQNFRLFADPGLINSVNVFKGESQKVGLNAISRLVENKYLYLLEYALLKFLTQFSPGTFFSAQEKLLNFSFSPPLYLGFIIPFIYGFYHWFNNQIKYRGLILLYFLFCLPSFFAHSIVDLNRLILVLPGVIFFITFGLEKLFMKRKKTPAKIFLIVIGIMIILQLVTTLIDIHFREFRRFRTYFGPTHLEISNR